MFVEWIYLFVQLPLSFHASRGGGGLGCCTRIDSSEIQNPWFKRLCILRNVVTHSRSQTAKKNLEEEVNSFRLPAWWLSWSWKTIKLLWWTLVCQNAFNTRPLTHPPIPIPTPHLWSNVLLSAVDSQLHCIKTAGDYLYPMCLDTSISIGGTWNEIEEVNWSCLPGGPWMPPSGIWVWGAGEGVRARKPHDAWFDEDLWTAMWRVWGAGIGYLGRGEESTWRRNSLKGRRTHLFEAEREKWRVGAKCSKNLLESV